MSPPVPSPPAALPFSELLEELRAAGMPVGIREHLTVGRLLDRWKVTDPDELRAALSAVLARNVQETELVRETFDRLYPATPQEDEGEELGEGPRRAREQETRWIRRVVLAALPLLAAVAAGIYWVGWLRPMVPSPPPVTLADRLPATQEPERPPPPKIKERDTVISLPNGWKAGGCALLAAALGLGLTYRRRTAPAVLRRMRQRWTEELDELPGPATYELRLRSLSPPFPAAVLDDIAALLGRRRDQPTGSRELDVDRTLERTLQAGLAPHLVFKVPALGKKILVLEDIGPEMRPWRHRVAALLDGLAARGVDFERWQLDTDTGRLYQEGMDGSIGLRALARTRSEHSLLMISTGQGIYDAEKADPSAAEWVGLLERWRSRAWLHPLDDFHYWRPAMREIGPIAWPLTPAGALAAAQHLARGQARRRERDDQWLGADRPVAPLDVERLSWLISLAPRHDPELAELLRQRFCPQIPVAALVEALAVAQTARHQSGLRHPGIGPPADEVHAFLAATLAESEPAAESAAHLRWQLDRVLQELRGSRAEAEVAPARGELVDLAKGPAAAVLADPALRAGLDRHAAREIKASLASRARKEVWKDLATTTESRAWAWPRLPELVAALTCGLLVFWMSWRLDFLTHDTTTRGQEVYRLSLDDASSPSMLRLERLPGVNAAQAPDDVELIVAGSGEAAGVNGVLTDMKVPGNLGTDVGFLVRPGWYWASAGRSDGLVALSNQVWLPAAPIPPPDDDPLPSPDDPARLSTGTLLVKFYLTPTEGHDRTARPWRTAMEPKLPSEYSVYPIGAGEQRSLRGQARQPLELPAGYWRVEALDFRGIVTTPVEVRAGQETSAQIGLFFLPMSTYPPTTHEIGIAITIDKKSKEQSNSGLVVHFFDSSLTESGSFEILLEGDRSQSVQIKRTSNVEFLRKRYLQVTNTGDDEWGGTLSFSLYEEHLFSVTIPARDGFRNESRTADLAELFKTRNLTLKAPTTSNNPTIGDSGTNPRR